MQSDLINAEMWTIGESKPNGDEDMSFDEAVKRLKKAYLNKFLWLDSQISGFDI